MKKNLSLLLLISVNIGIYSSTGFAQKVQFDSAGIKNLRSIPFLPDPLVIDEGGKNIPVVTPSQWKQKQDWIREQYQYCISGSVPPAPKTFHVKVMQETMEDDIKLRTVELSFGPDDKAKMTVELMIPTSKKRLPVFLTQWNHRGWAQVAVRRGYIGCVYAGADMKDDTRNYTDVFRGYDFGTLMKRAWEVRGL
jgi:hypothetical protein